MKKLLVFAALGLSIAGAKSFHITLSSPAQVGGVQLKAGEYELVPEQSKVRFIDVLTRHTVEAEAKIEDGARKFSQTAIQEDTVNCASQIKEIDLGGTKTKIEFR